MVEALTYLARAGRGVVSDNAEPIILVVAFVGVMWLVLTGSL
jgi:hypothetical protein